MRQRPGIGGLQNGTAASRVLLSPSHVSVPHYLNLCFVMDQYRLLGDNAAKLRTDPMKQQLASFRSQLQNFAVSNLCVFFSANKGSAEK
ncbi:UNVERIFIED_CONTAM: Vacuolar protein sorting-associated protein [Sesamum radiatum]|uniref:Vacuolar protein sorting-associated protein n=1 Tax=Sesamum radiatum TaxID=300843 RepID=A0AAW2K5H4_SESRA